MHQITFKVVSTNEWFGGAVEIELDGVNLVELVRDFEMPMAAAEGAPSIAGGYVGIAAASHLPPSKHFLGIHSPPRREGAKTDILWCRDCGEAGCWPLLTRISVDNNRVTWSQFEQPYRSDNGVQTPWTYDDFGPFTFDRSQYESALNEAAATHTE